MRQKRFTNYIFKAIILSAIIFCGLVFIACDAGNKSVTVKLCDGETSVGEKTVEIGSEYSFGVPTKHGYSFLGWYDSPENGRAYTNAAGDSSGLVWKEDNSNSVYAYWQANTYEIVLNYCGATGNSSVERISATYGEKITERLPVPQKTNYSFMGWFTAESGGVKLADSDGIFVEEYEVYRKPTYSTSQDGTVVYAHWSRKSVTYTFFAGDKQVNKAVKHEVGDVISELEPTISDNNCFVGWYFDSTTKTPLTLPYTVEDGLDSNVALYAKFEQGSNDILKFDTIVATADREYEVTYSGDAEIVIVPDSYYGKKITKIKRIDAPNATRIVLPQTVKELGANVFSGCAKLESVNIPQKVKLIPRHAFSGCTALRTVIIPNKVESILEAAFNHCENIERLRLPSSVKTIGTGTFFAMNKLKEFTVDRNNENYIARDGVLYRKIGNSLHLVQYPLAKDGNTYELEENAVRILSKAFAMSQIESIVLSGRLSTIDDEAFSDCKNLVSLNLSSTANSLSIGDRAFGGCEKLKAVKIEMSKIPTLGEAAFSGVSNTFSVYVTSNLINSYKTVQGWREITDCIFSVGMIYGNYAIEDCGDGQGAIRQYFGTENTVIIPEIISAKKIVKIADNAFSYSSMKEVVISQYVKEIGSAAFKGCHGLESIIVKCDVPKLQANAFDDINADFAIYVDNTADVLSAYKSANVWSGFADRIWTYIKKN